MHDGMHDGMVARGMNRVACTHTYTHTQIYIRTHAHTQIYIRTHTHTHKYTYAHTHAHAHIHTHTQGDVVTLFF